MLGSLKSCTSMYTCSRSVYLSAPLEFVTEYQRIVLEPRLYIRGKWNTLLDRIWDDITQRLQVHGLYKFFDRRNPKTAVTNTCKNPFFVKLSRSLAHTVGILCVDEIPDDNANTL
ncbi:hypothetical protein PsorP6_001702 [Peronosclerospora sorghi]|uniref:Uncharacterized protein n=1 Tax=Peronosclerospora sorghi TaxID=230839 RepID=A0ACC0WU80_9STRA|nr:hypothetical protein PsorP6_001702 [Peronosclerospora sorghi]